MLPYSPETVAEALLAILDQAAARRGRATLAIPGGRSPGPVLTALARIVDPFVRNRLDLFWLDERAVPHGHPDRNDAPTLAAWSSGGPLPARVHPMPADAANLDEAALVYGELLGACTGDGVLDACLVGIGEDGHFASLFPSHPGLGDLAEVFVVRDSPKPPAVRLTMGLGTVVRARHRLVLALGGAKGAVLRAVRSHGPDRALPVSLLPEGGTTWYVDDAAAVAVRDL